MAALPRLKLQLQQITDAWRLPAHTPTEPQRGETVRGEAQHTNRRYADKHENARYTREQQ